MTLPEFFQKLIDETAKADIPHEMRAHMPFDVKAWVIGNLQKLQGFSDESKREFWGYQESTNCGLWDASVPYLMNAGILSKYMHRTELRNQLREFLGRPQVV